ncbi:hypothetical protein PFLUV_G00024730 [Perca fluviatilis]|uniref:Uncharacterized protein n=1 Tax=Perca fluviatilis TaxID=8168 RepID=A0A6A5FPV7_PERFL|nr:hypothetical protein PFLUV_G00024730 [Perca fluviatilis]
MAIRSHSSVGFKASPVGVPSSTLQLLLILCGRLLDAQGQGLPSPSLQKGPNEANLHPLSLIKLELTWRVTYCQRWSMVWLHCLSILEYG